MNRLPSILMFAACVLLTACSCVARQTESESAGSAPAAMAGPRAEHTAAAQPDSLVIRDERGSAILEKIPFHPGVSSATVERLARRFGCTGSTGAGLITDKGPLEVYRLQCDNGTTFMAQCELRQCRPMR